jgi:class 3 adenylate cyclase
MVAGGWRRDAIWGISRVSNSDALREQIADLRREQESAEEREAAVRDVVQTIAHSTFDLDVVLQAVIDRAVHLCHADNGNIARREDDVFRVAAFTSFAPGYQRLVRERVYLPERSSAIGRTVLERRVVHIVDVLDDAEYSLEALQTAGGYRTVLGVPMLREGTPIGAIVVGRNEVRPFSDPEIRLIETFADFVVVAIENVRLFQTVERQRTELARFAPQVADLLSTDEGEQLLAGHRREITALFCDLRGFTAFAETAEPEEVLGVLREYHVAAGELVIANKGAVEHFAGDGLMAFFNDPTPIPEHQLAAVRTAVAMGERFAGLAAEWRKRGYDLGLGMGIATGYATLGRIGFEGRYDYGAVGNVVILASRLSDVAGPGEILLSQRMHAAVDDRVVTEPAQELQLKGFSRPVVALRAIKLHD